MIPAQMRQPRQGACATLFRTLALLITVAAGLLASGCGPAAPPEQRNAAQPAETPENIAIEQDVANIQTDVMRASQAQRLDDLERRVSRLETNPEKLDLELLSSRVQALEVKAGADSLAATPVAVPGPSPTPKPPRKKPAPRSQPSPTNTAKALVTD